MLLCTRATRWRAALSVVVLLCVGPSQRVHVEAGHGGGYGGSSRRKSLRRRNPELLKGIDLRMLSNEQEGWPDLYSSASEYSDHKCVGLNFHNERGNEAYLTKS